jgi:hypothetical protein
MRAAHDDDVAAFAHAGDDWHAHIGVSVFCVICREHPDDHPSGLAAATGRSLHHATHAAADDNRLPPRDLAADLFGQQKKILRRVTLSNDGDARRWRAVRPFIANGHANTIVV